MIIARLSNSYVAEVSPGEMGLIKLALERFVLSWTKDDVRRYAMEEQARPLIGMIEATLKGREAR